MTAGSQGDLHSAPGCFISKDVGMLKIKVKRPLSLWDGWVPLSVKLNGRKMAAVKNGDDSVISLPESRTELSVAYFHDRSEKITVESGDVITVKRNRASRFVIAAVIIAVLIPLIPAITGQDMTPYFWAMLAALGIILAISQMLKSYDIEQTGKLTEEELAETEDVEGVRVKRTAGLFEPAQPLSVKLNEEEKKKLKSGEQAVIPMKEDDAEMSVEFLYEAGNRVKVESGDIVSIKRNWIFYAQVIILAIVLIGLVLSSVLGISPGIGSAFYAIAILAALVTAVAMTLMKTVKLEVVDKAH